MATKKTTTRSSSSSGSTKTTKSTNGSGWGSTGTVWSSTGGGTTATKSKSPTSGTTYTEWQLRDEIARKAYQYYIDRGYNHGYDVEDWHRAEKEVRSRYSKN